MPTDFDTGLARNAANFVPLTPIEFLARAADVYGDRLAIVHGSVRQNWRDTYTRARRMASALAQAGVGRGDTVAALLPNTPAMVEAHFGVPMAGAVLNALNIRLDAANLVFMLRHGEARVLLADTEFADLARQMALEIPGLKVIAVRDYLAGTRTANGVVEPTGLPKSNVLYFELEAGCWVCVRPSGTEPKIKLYVNACAPTKEEANALNERLHIAGEALLA